MLRRALPVALLAAAAAGLSLEAPTLLQCDGSDYSPAAHPRHSFAVRSGKAAYELRWAVGASFADTAERARLQPVVAMTGFDIAVADKLGGPVWSSTLNGTEPRFQLSESTMGPAFARLLPGNTYVWTVRWASGALRSPPAAAAFHLSPADDVWNGTYWIGSNTTNLYEASFPTPAALVEANLYVCGLGFSNVEINGQGLSDPDPMLTVGPWTPNDFLNGYSTWDVSALLKPAGQANLITVGLGNGWRVLPPKDKLNTVGDYTNRVFRLAMVGLLKDATKPKMLVSDAAQPYWMGTPQQVVFDSLYDGETFDTRVVRKFEKVAGNIAAADGPQGAMVPWIGPYIHLDREVKAVNVTQPQPGIFVVDFGVNLAGVVRMTNYSKWKGYVPAGENVTLRHGEILQHAGIPGLTPQPGMIYTGNLRSARATDVFILGGDYTESKYHPKYTYHGFRYLEVSGYSATPAGLGKGFEVSLDDFTLLHHHTMLKQTAFVEFADPLLNAMQTAALGSQRSNLQTIVTDCDQRDERLGWIGDMGLSSSSIALNYDAHQHFTYLLEVMESEVYPDGSLPDIVPWVHGGDRPADVSWSIAFFNVVHEVWRVYGDVGVVERHLPTMVAHLGNVAAQARQAGICTMRTPHGDWCPPPLAAGNASTEQHAAGGYVTLSSYVVMASLAQTMANATGNATAATQLQSLLAELKTQFVACYWHAGNSTFGDDLQANYALAAAVSAAAGGLAQAPVIDQKLLTLLDASGNASLSGIVGFKYLFDALLRAGAPEYALAVMLRHEYPSIGYMVTNTIEPVGENLWEILDAPVEGGGMNSRNHHMWSSFSAYLVRSVAGVDWAHRTLRAPHLPAGGQPTRVHGASSRYESHHGNVSLAWEYIGGIQGFSAYPTVVAAAGGPLDLPVACGASRFLEAGAGGVWGARSVQSVASVAFYAGGALLQTAPAAFEQVHAALAAQCVGTSSQTCRFDLRRWSAALQAHAVTEVRATVRCEGPLTAAVQTTVPIGVSLTLEAHDGHTVESAVDGSAFTGVLPPGTSSYIIRRSS